MPSFTTKAVVLKNFVYQDTDKIYTFLSRDRGKISGIGKGVRKISSKRGSNLDTLNLVKVHLYEHKSGQNYVTEVKIIDSFKGVKENLGLSKQAFYIAELVNKFLYQDENAEAVFDLLVKSLKRLETGNGEVSLRINKFEIELMKTLGYQPPSEFIKKWKTFIEQKNYNRADEIMKDFVAEILQDKLKSLELN